jgi:hypothetical protein
VWNPLQSERHMFRFLVQVGIFCLAIAVIVVVLRAIF